MKIQLIYPTKYRLLYWHLCVRFCKFLRLACDTGKTGIDALINQLVLIALEVVLEFSHATLGEVDLGEAVGQVSPLLFCPVGQESILYM